MVAGRRGQTGTPCVRRKGRMMEKGERLRRWKEGGRRKKMSGIDKW